MFSGTVVGGTVGAAVVVVTSGVIVVSCEPTKNPPRTDNRSKTLKSRFEITPRNMSRD